jgi:hypothetical protein
MISGAATLRRSGVAHGLWLPALCLGLTAAALATMTQVPSASLRTMSAALLFLGVAGWMFLSEREGLTLGVLALYLGLADGYFKLSTGSPQATLARDVLLYGICFGIAARALIRRQEMRLPPYAGVIVVYVLLVIVQLANPGTGGLGHALASLRPHIEFVPLFFLGYIAVRTKSRLRGLLVLLVVVGAVNGIVSYVQFTMTPDQLSAWGPGYAERIQGKGVSGRTFYDNRHQERVRPFGLAADSGQGGFVGLLALPATIALVSVARGRWRWIALILGFAVTLAIVTSQGRTIMIGAGVAVVGYTVLTVVARRLVPTLAGMAAVGLALLAATSFSSDNAGAGAFDRVGQIAPSRLLDTARQQRESSILVAPTYLGKYPFGAGLGSVGPAAAVGREQERGLNGETEFNFLILELGIAGACVFLGLLAAVIRRTFRRLRAISDAELRALLAALAAPLLAMVVMFFGSTITAGSPGAPYFWGMSGVLAYWLRPSKILRRNRPTTAHRSSRPSSSLPAHASSGPSAMPTSPAQAGGLRPPGGGSPRTVG